MKPHEHRLSTQPKTIIVTVSTSRYLKKLEGKPVEDPSGDLAESLLRKKGITDISRRLISDDEVLIKNIIEDAKRENVHMIIFIGGTGVSPDDITVETLKPLFRKELTAFQVLFTVASFREVGSRAVSSRSTAGIIDNILVFALPGSLNAVKTALEEIILNEYEHLLYIAGILK